MYRLPAQAIASASPNPGAMTLEQLGNFDSAGNVEIPQAAASEVGIANISWQKGQNPAQALPLGVWNTAFGVGDLTPQQINPQTPDLNGAALSNFSYLKGQNIGSVVKAIPALKNLPIDRVKPIFDAVGILSGRNPPRTVGDLANNPFYAQKLLPDNLAQYPASSIPGLTDTPIKNFSGIMGLKAIDVPGLAQLPLAQMPKFNLPAGYQLAKFDLIRTKEVADRKVISGSKEEPNAVCTDASKCNHIEVQSLGGGAINGAQIVDGDTQRVKGGYGLLGAISGGKEAPGFYPYGDRIKEVYYNFQATEGTIDRGWYFDYCQSGWFVDFGCTPHFIGPIPLGKLHEGSQIPLLLGNINIPISAGEVVSTATAIGKEIQDTTPSTPPTASTDDNSSIDLSSDRKSTDGVPKSPNVIAETATQLTGGIDSQKLTNAIVNILPNGNAKQIGQLLNATAQEIDPDTGAKFTGSKLIDRITTKYIAGNNAEIGSDAQSIDLGMSVSEIVARVSQNYGQK